MLNQVACINEAARVASGPSAWKWSFWIANPSRFLYCTLVKIRKRPLWHSHYVVQLPDWGIDGVVFHSAMRKVHDISFFETHYTHAMVTLGWWRDQREHACTRLSKECVAADPRQGDDWGVANEYPFPPKSSVFKVDCGALLGTCGGAQLAYRTDEVRRVSVTAQVLKVGSELARPTFFYFLLLFCFGMV